MAEGKIDKLLHKILDLINTKPLPCDVDNLYNIYEDYTDNMRYTIIEKDEILNKIFTLINKFNELGFSTKVNYIGNLYHSLCRCRIQYKPIKLPSGKEYYIPTTEEKINYIIYKRYELIVKELDDIHYNDVEFMIRTNPNASPTLYHRTNKELLDISNQIQQSKLEEQQTKQEYTSLKNKKKSKLITYIKENHREAFEDIITKLNSANILQPLYDNIRFEYKWLGGVLDFAYFVALLNGKKLTEYYLKEEPKETTGIRWQIFLNAFEVRDKNGMLLEKSNKVVDKYRRFLRSNRTATNFDYPDTEKEPYLNCYKIHKIVKETNKYYFQ